MSELKNDSGAKDNQENFNELLSNLTNILKRTGASNRSIPSWDSSAQKSAVSIKSHIKLFENLAKLYYS